ncbi:uncharacterized protein PV09_04576 [Verruconis gallopava]|uniref:Carboxypeptidase n=1 Tax=Verruconis gallopava TaxID=253628 RepID=A0A0D2AYM6_9PEZI|nr:uncharacterized protein PV09_04576 [Verruconis gallopava]KIW04274.1 hypothetical protein PV09_04576 [Verruconis gallopava]
MARYSIGRLAALALMLTSCWEACYGKETMGERAQSVRQRRAAMAQAQKSRFETRDKGTYRYLTNQTEAFKVDSLPDVTDDPGEMYGGQIPVGNDTSKQMFFMFQPTIGDPVDEITIWFNGGPGCSSLEAFLQENGLFIWGWGMYNAEVNKYSWVNLTNMLWVEYPLGLGFSTTSNVTATSEEETAADFIGFFRNFQDIFGIKNYKIYITGESYAGRYVPYVASAMIDQNDTEYFNVSGALMYDPVIGQYEYIGQTVPTVPYIQKYAMFFNFNETFMSELESAHKSCGYADYLAKYMTFPPAGLQPPLEGMFNQTSQSCDVWTNAYTAASQPNPCFNVYEISTMCPVLSDPLGYPSDLEYLYSGMKEIYFNRTDVKTAIHAPLDVDWSECSGPVFAGEGGGYGNGDASIDPIQSVLPKVIEKTNRVLVANGDYDFEILTMGTLLSIQNMTWNGKLGFQKEPKTPIDIKLPDLQYQAAFDASGMPGYDGPGQGIMGIQHYERGLMWAETFQSGHMQPQFQPRSSYRHLQWLLGHIDRL